MNIVILGKPGSGKGTQAEILSKKCNLYHFSTGDYFRKEMYLGTKLGKKVEQILKTPTLIPDELVNEIAKKVIMEHNHENIMFDGYPRTVAQARFLHGYLKKQINYVFLLDVSDEIALKRQHNRQKKNPRVDSSSLEKLKSRLKIFKEMTEPLIEFYKKKNLFQIIDGESDIKTIARELERIVKCQQ